MELQCFSAAFLAPYNSQCFSRPRSDLCEADLEDFVLFHVKSLRKCQDCRELLIFLKNSRYAKSCIQKKGWALFCRHFMRFLGVEFRGLLGRCVFSYENREIRDGSLQSPWTRSPQTLQKQGLAVHVSVTCSCQLLDVNCNFNCSCSSEPKRTKADQSGPKRTILSTPFPFHVKKGSPNGLKTCTRMQIFEITGVQNLIHFGGPFWTNLRVLPQIAHVQKPRETQCSQNFVVFISVNVAPEER